VYGKHNVPRRVRSSSPIHRSNLDSPAIAPITTRRMRYMGKESLWKRGGAPGTSRPGVPSTPRPQALKACQVVLERRAAGAVPEGTRQSGPVVTEMCDGPAWLACRAQVPILPIGIGGSETAMGKGAKFPRPVRMTIVVGEPLYPPKPGPNGRVPRRAVRELSDELRAALQALFDEAQSLAGTPNPPHD
jgi:1-acyl-sn-glycerol-3-phosphate acyltransferase